MRRLILTLATVAVGCGDDVSGTETGNSSGDDDSGTLSSSATAADGSSTSASGSASATESGSESSAGGSTGDAGGSEEGSSDSAADSETGGGETFPCGEAITCLVATQYCQETVGGAQGSRPQYQCMDLPGGCAPAPTCDCVQDTPCAMICEMSGAGVIVTCQAP